MRWISYHCNRSSGQSPGGGFENRRRSGDKPGLDQCRLGIEGATGWRGVDAAIEYSGSMEALQAALPEVAFGGNVVLGGFPDPMKVGLDLGAEAHMNRPMISF